MTPQLLTLALDHAAQLAPREACALLIEAKGEPFYWRCENVSSEADFAVPAAKDMAGAEDAGRVLGFVHSHPNGPTSMSKLDVKGSEAMKMPWWVVNPSDRTWCRYDPSSRDLLGRSYVLGVDDCWSLIRDWYWRERKINLIDDTRDIDSWGKGFGPYLEKISSTGFTDVAFSSLLPGDVMLFSVASREITHASVYLGDGIMLHHIDGSLSRTEHISQAWLKRLKKVARWRGL